MTEQSEQSKAFIDLGKKLVTELDLDNSVDTLGRWMTHYVAELILETEGSNDNDRSVKQAQLRDAILALWKHRFELPMNRRPFNDFEPILRALESLDPENKIPRYFSSAYRSEDGESEKTRQWIEVAKGFDYTAKILINHCLVSAADTAIDKSMEWVELAKKIGLDDSYEVRVIEFVSGEKDLMKEHNENASQRRILTERLEKLETFVSLTSAVIDDIKVQLEKMALRGDETE